VNKKETIEFSVIDLPSAIFVGVPIGRGSYEHTNDEEKVPQQTCKREILQRQRKRTQSEETAAKIMCGGSET
jgi:hypothetical protein